MKIWLVRHGQTELNRARLMQGRSDLPLNETGIRQAQAAADRVQDIAFDGVISSPLVRAIHTASLISGKRPEEIRTDSRLLETDFGRYEKRPYLLLGPSMTLYWALPEFFPAPRTVETIASMVERSTSFLEDLSQETYENVLISCHGGIIRALCGCLENRPHGILWRPKPHNCEFRVYSSQEGGWTRIEPPLS